MLTDKDFSFSPQFSHCTNFPPCVWTPSVPTPTVVIEEGVENHVSPPIHIKSLLCTWQWRRFTGRAHAEENNIPPRSTLTRNQSLSVANTLPCRLPVHEIANCWIWSLCSSISCKKHNYRLIIVHCWLPWLWMSCWPLMPIQSCRHHPLELWHMIHFLQQSEYSIKLSSVQHIVE